MYDASTDNMVLKLKISVLFAIVLKFVQKRTHEAGCLKIHYYKTLTII